MRHPGARCPERLGAWLAATARKRITRPCGWSTGWAAPHQRRIPDRRGDGSHDGRATGDQDAAARSRPATIDIYNTQAETLPVYRGLKSDAPNWWRFVPTGPTDAADIGAGFGFDARRLAAAGIGSSRLSRKACGNVVRNSTETGASLRWLDSQYPELEGLRVLGLSTSSCRPPFDASRTRGTGGAMASVAALLAPGGRFVLTVRHGPPPKGGPCSTTGGGSGSPRRRQRSNNPLVDGLKMAPAGGGWFRTVLTNPQADEAMIDVSAGLHPAPRRAICRL